MKREEYNEFRSRAAYVGKMNRENRKPIEIYIPVGSSSEFNLKLLQAYDPPIFKRVLFPLSEVIQ